MINKYVYQSFKGYIGDFFTRSYFDIITVQAPHPPSAHPNLVPHKLTEVVWLKKFQLIDRLKFSLYSRVR